MLVFIEQVILIVPMVAFFLLYVDAESTEKYIEAWASGFSGKSRDICF